MLVWKHQAWFEFFTCDLSGLKKKSQVLVLLWGGGVGGGQLFSPNPRSGGGFCREKNSKNFGRGGKNSGHLVRPVQLF